MQDNKPIINLDRFGRIKHVLALPESTRSDILRSAVDLVGMVEALRGELQAMTEANDANVRVYETVNDVHAEALSTVCASLCHRCEFGWDQPQRDQGGEWCHWATTTPDGTNIWPEPCTAGPLREYIATIKEANANE